MLLRQIAAGVFSAALALAVMYWLRPSRPAEIPTATVVAYWPDPIRPSPIRITNPNPLSRVVDFDRIIDRFEVSESTLDDAVRKLVDATGENIVIDRPAIHGFSNGLVHVGAISLQRVPLGTLLNVCVHGVLESGATLTWRVENGVIVLATENDFAVVDSQTRIFDIRDLVLESIRFGRQADSIAGGRLDQRNSIPGSGSYPPPISPVLNEEEAVATVENMIMNFIAPETWMQSGGMVGRMDYWAGRLIVTHNPETLEKVAARLAEMHAVIQKQPK